MDGWQPVADEMRAMLRAGRDGVLAWNDWRRKNPGVRPDLSKSDFSGADLTEVDLKEAALNYSRFNGAKLTDADFWRAHVSQASFEAADLTSASMRWALFQYCNFDGAVLRGAHLEESNLYGSTFRNADLEGADLRATYLLWTHFTNANLGKTNLQHASLIEAEMSGTTLTGSSVYGLSAWEISGVPKDQTNLVITPTGEGAVVTDDLRIAQFLYLLLGNQEIRNVIDMVTSKVVLILGRFTSERKAVLHALQTELRQRHWVPVVCDFERPSNRNLTETVSTLAHLARFVIADITDAKSIPQELQRIVPGLPSLTIQPIILSASYEYGMFADFLDYPWVLPLYRYDSIDQLLASLVERVIHPADAKAVEIIERRRRLTSH